MASAQTRKRKSDEMATPEAATPTGSPTIKKMKISESQKQALIDNLQLEITERARRLRAQYALQCKDLRTRIERRVNRIPLSMRNMTMAELMNKHKESLEPAPKPAMKLDEQPLPSSLRPVVTHPASPIRVAKTTQPTRNRKRKSSEIHIASDKENDLDSNVSVQEVLPVQKNTKRVKTNTTRTVKNPGGVLSPRSHNSRTLPRSPIKDKAIPPMSPSKQSYIARPVSPLKSPFKTAASAATSAISASVHGMLESARQKGAALGSKSTRTNKARNASKDSTTTMPPPAKGRGAAAMAANRTASQMSNHSASTEVSTSSNATDTTVVTKPKRGRAANTGTKTANTSTATKGRKAATTTMAASVAAAAKATATKINAAQNAGTLKKTASTSTKKAAAESGTATRVLRKRN